MRFEQAEMIRTSPGAMLYGFYGERVVSAVVMLPGMRLQFRTKPKSMNQATPRFTGVLLGIDKDAAHPYRIEYLRPGVGKVVEAFSADEFQELAHVGYSQGEAHEFASILH